MGLFATGRTACGYPVELIKSAGPAGERYGYVLAPGYAPFSAWWSADGRLHGAGGQPHLDLDLETLKPQGPRRPYLGAIEREVLALARDYCDQFGDQAWWSIAKKHIVGQLHHGRRTQAYRALRNLVAKGWLVLEGDDVDALLTAPCRN